MPPEKRLQGLSGPKARRGFPTSFQVGKATKTLGRYPNQELPKYLVRGRPYPYLPKEYSHILAIVRTHFGGNLRNRKILEIGPGKTSFLEQLKREGADIAGIEPTPPAEIPEGIRIEKGFYHEIPEKFKEGEFDAIVSRGVFNRDTVDGVNKRGPEWVIKAWETTEAIAEVRGMASVLKPGGIFVIQTQWPVSFPRQMLEKYFEVVRYDRTIKTAKGVQEYLTVLRKK